MGCLEWQKLCITLEDDMDKEILLGIRWCEGIGGGGRFEGKQK